MIAQFPDPIVVVLVGAAGSGKSHWAATHFAANQIVSSDGLRAAVGRGENDLEASADAFALLDTIVAKRISRRLTTVIDTLGFGADLRRRVWTWRGTIECRVRSWSYTRPRRSARNATGSGRNGCRQEFSTTNCDGFARLSTSCHRGV